MMASDLGFRAAVAKLRDSGALGRSDVLGRLFDFLAERSLADDPPKEAEVAIAVFGKQGGFDAMQDASVRVAVLRLRRKLDDHYAAQGDGPRLAIPKGEYRIVLDHPAVPEDLETETSAAPVPLWQRHARLLLGAAAALFLLSAAGWGWLLTHPPSTAPDAAALAPWSGFDRRQPIDVVVGDYYIFGENGPTGEVARMVREFAINSKSDLDTYLMSNPDKMGRYVDMGLNYLPQGVAPVVGAIQPMVHAAGAPALRVFSASSLTAQRIKDGQLVYVGWLSALGLLRDPVFAASNFEVGSTYDELIDRTDGHHYITDWDQTDPRTRHRDYGYFASFPGPGGKPIVIVAGLRDAGLTQMSDLVANAGELKRLQAVAKSRAFEALYEVQALDNTILASRPVAVHAMRIQGLWDTDGSGDAFPDQLKAGGAH